jgi:hypothetical protein
MESQSQQPRAACWRRYLHKSHSTSALLLLCLFLVAGTCPVSELLGAGVVINEIMYHPPEETDELQFVELFNHGKTPVDLSDWSFTKGIKFTFEKGTVIQPDSYLVVCRDKRAFSTHYGDEISVVGDFSGRLSHSGERIELSDALQRVVDSLKYHDRGEWPRGPDGFSGSLERICPSAPSDLPANWSSSKWSEKKTATGTPGSQNNSFSSKLPPAISAVGFVPKTPSPREQVKVTAFVSDPDEVKSVLLLFTIATTGQESEEAALSMSLVSGDARAGMYEAVIPAQPHGHLVRFRIKASCSSWSERLSPSENEPRRSHSYVSFAAQAPSRIPLGFIINVGQPARGLRHYERNPSSRHTAASIGRGEGAFIYLPANAGPPELFDHVKVVRRHGGVKVYFHKDAPLKGMTTINLISEGPPRWLLSEPLSYALYRMAGVPAPLTEHVRVTIDGRCLGYQLLVEQPNRSFLARNGRDDRGDLYKLIWFERGVERQHEKKTNPSTGHEELIRLIDGLNGRSGAGQWDFIQEHFNVDLFASYYAVNMCIQNWDGFFNNYFVYHDKHGSGKWEIYPWDCDKTWGDYDGASQNYDWHQMPLTLGMGGDQPPRSLLNLQSRGPFGGANWWRPPGHLSGPLLANPQFRRLFLARLSELNGMAFSAQSLHPIIGVMQKRLSAQEVEIRAQAIGEDPVQARKVFDLHIGSLQRQVEHRGKFMEKELRKRRRGPDER